MKKSLRNIIVFCITCMLITSIPLTAFAATKSISVEITGMASAKATITYTTKYENGKYVWNKFRISSPKVTEKSSAITASGDSKTEIIDPNNAVAVLMLFATQKGSYIPYSKAASCGFELDPQTGEVTISESD